IVISISGLFFGAEAARGNVVGQLRDLVGEEGAHAVEAMVANAWSPTASIVAATVGVITLVIGATGVFAELQDALNTIWKVPPRARGGILLVVKDRFLSLAMILCMGFLLLVSLVIHAGLEAMGTWFAGIVPANWSFVLQAINLLLTFGVTL